MYDVKVEQCPHQAILLCYVLCHFLFSDTAPSHQQSLTALRGSRDLVKYALTTALQKLKEV